MDRRKFMKNSALGMVGAGILGGKSLLKAEAKKGTGAKIKEYRTLGRTGFEVSDISTGGPGDEALLAALLDAGVNYIDNAESYWNGKCESIVGTVMKNRDRKKVFITTKQVIHPYPGMPYKEEENTKEGIKKRFYKSLERMQTDYADCLMIHAVPDEKILKHEGFHTAVKELKAEGKLKHAGISNHGSVDPGQTEVMGKVIMAAAEDGRFDLVLMTYNHLQEDLSLGALKACHDKKIGVTLMKTNPVGGYLGMKEAMEKLQKEEKEIPKYLKEEMPIMKQKYEEAQGFLKKHNLEDPQDIRDAAIKFCLNNDRVNSVCISFRNFDDVEKYVGLSGMRLTAADETALAVYARAFGQFYCRHACGICESSCPQKVPVNTVMRYNHYFSAQGREKYAMEMYAKLNAGVANNCFNCDGICEASCPYKVPIQKLLVLADQNLTLV